MKLLRTAVWVATVVSLGCGSSEISNNTANNSTTNNASTSSNNDDTTTTNNSTTNNSAAAPWCREPVALEVDPRPVSSDPFAVSQGPDFIWAIATVDFQRQVIRSADGSSWEIVEVPDGATTKNILATESFVVVARTRDTYDVSSDGGTTWTTMVVEGPMSTANYASLPDSTLIRWRLSEGLIETSTDAVEWTPLNLARNEPMLAVSVGSEGTIAVTRPAAAELTDDLGQSWTTVTPPGPFESFYVFTDNGERRYITRSSTNRGLVWESSDGVNWDENRVFGRDPIPVEFVQVGGQLFADGGWSGEPVRKRSAANDWSDMPSVLDSLDGHFQIDSEHRLVTGDVAITTTDLNGSNVEVFTFDEPIIPRINAAGVAFGRTLVAWSWADIESEWAAMLGVIEPDCTISPIMRDDEFRAGFDQIWTVPGLVVVRYWPTEGTEDSAHILVETDDSFDFFEPDIGLASVKHVQRLDDTFLLLGPLESGQALIRSADGIEWTAPEPVLKTPETVALEQAESPQIILSAVVRHQDKWLGISELEPAGEFGFQPGIQALYMSDDLTNWDRIEVQLPFETTGKISINQVASAGDRAVISVSSGPPEARERGVLISNDLTNWQRREPASLGDYQILHGAGDRAVLGVDANPAFGSAETFRILYVLEGDEWQEITDDLDLSYLGWAPGRFLLSDDATLIPLE